MDPIELSAVEIRVLGCLIEKEWTTPDYYPMTLNGTTNACNQKSNREPVVSYSEETVLDALDSLREKGLTRKIFSGGTGRVPKHRHVLDEVYAITPAEAALLSVMMVREPQTLGELRSRTQRMFSFESLADVEATLEQLIQRDVPLAQRLPRRPGRKEIRFTHCWAAAPMEEALWEGDASEESAESHTSISAAPPSSPTDPTQDPRMEILEAQVADLTAKLEALTAEFAEFRRQFE